MSKYYFIRRRKEEEEEKKKCNKLRSEIIYLFYSLIKTYTHVCIKCLYICCLRSYLPSYIK